MYQNNPREMITLQEERRGAQARKEAHFAYAWSRYRQSLILHEPQDGSKDTNAKEE